MPEIREVRFSPEVVETRQVFVSVASVDPERGIWDCITAFVPTDQGYGAESEGGRHDDG